MKLTINTEKWSIVEKDDKSKTIGGLYTIKCGPKKVASSEFNAGYGSTDIPIPTELLVKAEELDKLVKEAIITHFGGEEQ